MSPAKNGNKFRLQASVKPETWERYAAESRRLGIDVSALLEIIATLLPLHIELEVSSRNTKSHD